MVTTNDITIGKAARRAGVGVETIRFYERKGLIEQPARPAFGGFRSYPAETVARVRFIREAQVLGFTLGEIGELLSLRADPAVDCSDVRARAGAKRQNVRRRIADLRRIDAALGTLIAACPGEGALGACTIIEALDRGGRQSTETKES